MDEQAGRNEEPRREDGRLDREEAVEAVKSRPVAAGAMGLLVGAAVVFVLLWIVGGNPFSSVNEVEYREIVVEDISDDGDQICWSTDPGRRDAPQDCAILTMDPAAAAPEEGERVTIGIVEVDPPDGEARTQVVYVRGAAPSDTATEGPGGS